MSVLVCLGGRAAFSQEGSFVGDIRIEGNQRISKETIQLLLTFQEGNVIQQKHLDESIQKILASDFFSDVRISREKEKIIVFVKEHSVVRKVYFEGNKKLEDKILSLEMLLSPLSLFSYYKLSSDRDRILEIYRRFGYFEVVIEPKMIVLDHNRIDIVYEITEGSQVLVEDISFVGNDVFASEDLKRVIMTQENLWYRFLSSTRTYDPERFLFDQNLLQKFYYNEGYLDFSILSATSSLSLRQNGFYLNFLLQEGNRYKIKGFELISDIPEVVASEYLQYIDIKEGDIYRQDKIEAMTQNIRNGVAEKGYALVNVDVNYTKNEETQEVLVEFHILPVPINFVNRIFIQGNERTYDHVIRRELLLSEGGSFNLNRLTTSQNVLNRIGYFSEASIQYQASKSLANYMDVFVRVKEKSTGSLSLGGGYSTKDGMILDISFSEINFAGLGQKIEANVSYNKNLFHISAGFSDSVFFGIPMTQGWRFFYSQEDSEQDTIKKKTTVGKDIYVENRYGGRMFIQYSYNYNFYHKWGYEYTYRNIIEVNNARSFFIQRNLGKGSQSVYFHELSYDIRNRYYNASRGIYWTLGNRYAGFGGKDRFLQTTTELRGYIPLTESEKVVLSGRMFYGKSIPLQGQRINLGQNYFLGGQNLRGFAEGGASARDKITNNDIGGVAIVYGTLELRFKIFEEPLLGFTGRIFFDGGWSDRPDIDAVDEKKIFYSSRIRSSMGVGLSWDSPLGPISIDYGYPLVFENIDELENLRIGFSTNF